MFVFPKYFLSKLSHGSTDNIVSIHMTLKPDILKVFKTKSIVCPKSSAELQSTSAGVIELSLFF